MTMRFGFLKLLDSIIVVSFFLEAVSDYIVSNEVTVTSQLHSAVIIFGIIFYIFLVIGVLRMVRVKNYETESKFAKVMQRKLKTLVFRTRCIYSISAKTYWTTVEERSA